MDNMLKRGAFAIRPDCDFRPVAPKPADVAALEARSPGATWRYASPGEDGVSESVRLAVRSGKVVAIGVVVALGIAHTEEQGWAWRPETHDG